MKKNKPQIIVICGPTGSGKSSIALKLAKEYSRKNQNVEIISADSRAIYKGMDIGTAKVLPNDNNGIPCHMIDIIDPNQKFTVALFKNQATKIIKKIHQRKGIPFLVGGTGLYINAIVDNLTIPKVEPDKKMRAEIEKEINHKGLNFVWQKLLEIDPQAEDFVQKENPRRVIRALEVCLKTGQPFSQLRSKTQSEFEILQIGIKTERTKLYSQINQRTEQMIENGLIEEVKGLLEKYPPSAPGLATIAYQEIISYIQNKITLQEAIDLIKKNTRHYARRQITWFKKDKRIHWVTAYSQANQLIKNFLAKNY
ncbi:tRNA (adenosine(37)-N6)-dimethylallyltransferase MiaA [Candidatus Parcubacteria bacterium 4484_255]|nr:MAG: tRNA (adenosine(37)-N6)-dimethylallyltransferase MiaA [Candidatus Parcubacteria bacterium 4484_255]